ncbi:MAG: 16S rRNA (cytosine(967)-C(5))-methyltransferase RsmB [Candidatus Hermodarchaeia archaeon]
MPNNASKVEISREEVAAEVLALWEDQAQSLRGAMGELAINWQITDWRIRTAIHSLVFETMRRLNTIDFFLNQVLEKTQIMDLDSFTRNTLRVATYLIHFTDIAPALATNEAVTIIKRRKTKRLAGFVNAVLRKVQQMKLSEVMKSFHENGQHELEYSVPRWLFDYINSILDTEEAQALLSTSLKNPSVYIRVNTLNQQTTKTIGQLEEEQFICTAIPELPEAFKLQMGTKPVTQTNVYANNAIYLQSLASVLVSRILDPKPSEIIIDLCAAPGSKTSHLAQLMKNTGNILAIDNMPLRVKEMNRNLLRLGVRNTHVILANIFKLPFREDFQVKAVLVDPPCSNTGVIQTRPEVKWTMTPDMIRRLTRVQSSMLNEASKRVAPGGFVVYSTCSLTLDENEHVIRDFLDANPDFQLLPTQPKLGSGAFEGFDNCQRLFPHRNDTEGFFIAKLKRS